MLAGWRGRIGRATPEALVRRMLVARLQSPLAGRSATSVQLRHRNEQLSSQAAAELGIEFIRAGDHDPLCISAGDWPRLRSRLLADGLYIQPLHEQYSYAAQSAWSVSTLDPRRSGIADLRGAGAIWQLYPGDISVPIDVNDFSDTIDAVYTWVDADDPQWAANYRLALEESGRSNEDSALSLARFTSRDELRYSLRSLEMNLPWINNVYLVTAGQRPSWLNEDHPNLIIVDHHDLFSEPESALPTFNSHAIESQLAHINGLSEHFIYVNDDVFFARYLQQNTFYGPGGQAKYCLTKGHFTLAEDTSLPVNVAASNNRDVVLKKFGRTTSRKYQHVAHPQRLAVHRQIHSDLGERIRHIAGQRFRSETDLSIPSSLAHQYAARMGMGIPSKVNYQYLDLGSESYYIDLLRLSQNQTLDMFCINEVHSSHDERERSAVLMAFLKSRFPLKSSFEH